MLDKNGNNHSGGHYKRDKDKLYIEEQAERKQNELIKARNRHYNTLDFAKVIATAAKIIIEKDQKCLTLKDFRQIAKDVYKVDTFIKARSLKRMMSTDIAKERLNQELIRIYTDAGLKKDTISTLLKEANDYATDKKDGNLKLKLAEKLEKAYGLADSSVSKPPLQQNNQFNFHELRYDKPQDQPANMTDENEKVQKETKNEESDVV